jgi:ABC-type glutathione transport system ATPase component
MPEEQASFDYSLGMRPTKLIGFCGVGGSGKTTTARRMAEVTQIPFHELSARPTFKRWHLDSEAAQLALTEEQRYHLQMDIHQDFEDNLRHLPGPYGLRPALLPHCLGRGTLGEYRPEY